MYKLLHPTDAHEADLCDDTSCCQAWISREERMQTGGRMGETLADKVSGPSRETDGMAVCYGGEPIQAVFHAASDGTTRSAQEVWGHRVAYLQAWPPREKCPTITAPSGLRQGFLRRPGEAGLGCDLSGPVEAGSGSPL